MSIEQQLERQRFANDYGLVDGVAMQRQNPQQFRVPHEVLKKHIAVGHFVELRIDSPRFSMHPDAAETCTCSSCNGEVTKPVLSHEQPASLVPRPRQSVPSRGWGEDFWVQVIQRDGGYFRGIIDNPLFEARLHDLHQGDEIVFRSDHVLSVHNSHRQEMVMAMDEADLKQLVQWLGTL